MGIVSGIGAVIHLDGSAESTVRRWEIAYRGLVDAEVATNTQGGTHRIPGNTDWRGYYLGYGHTPSVFPGDSFAFKGTTDGTKGCYGTAICDSILIRCPIRQGTKIEYRVDFSADGSLKLAADVGSTPLVDDTSVAAFQSIGRKVALGGTSQTVDGTDVPQLHFWDFLVASRNRPYVHTNTAGSVQRNPGNLDARFRYGVYVDNPADTTQLPTLQDEGMLKFYVTSTTFWELRWGLIEEIAQFGANVESAENVIAVVSGGLTTTSGDVKGSIYNPAGELKWGTAAA